VRIRKGTILLKFYKYGKVFYRYYNTFEGFIKKYKTLRGNNCPTKYVCSGKNQLGEWMWHNCHTIADVKFDLRRFNVKVSE
jgi:hypothetical protein